MRADDKAAIDALEEGRSIVQISKVHHDAPLRLKVVVEKKSWGCMLREASVPGTRGFTWDAFEPTGGKIVFDAKGERLQAAAPIGKHHP